jgi:hypothetical protein
MRGRLNLFQATMLRWGELHPYLAVHVVRVAKRCDRKLLEAHLAERLENAGLTGLVLDRGRSRFAFEGGPAVIDLTVLAGGEDPRETTRVEIVRQLNLRFPDQGRLCPFRFFAVDAGGSFDLGIVYDHFLAGGDSIAVLLRHCVEGYAEDRVDRPCWVPDLYPPTYRRLFLRRLGAAVLGLAYLPALAASCRRAQRAPCHGHGEASNGFLAYRIDPAAFDRLRRASKRWGVTVGDLFLAALLLALDPFVAKRRAAPRRREIGVASIVNLRGEFASEAGASFGQFLASLRVSHEVPSGIGLAELAAAVHAETSRARTKRLYLQSLIGLGVSGFMWRFLSLPQRRCFLAKHYPIWAGLTAIHVDPLWNGAPAPAPASEYLRAVSTGPLAPLVFAISTLGDVAWLGVSFRSGV